MKKVIFGMLSLALIILILVILFQSRSNKLQREKTEMNYCDELGYMISSEREKIDKSCILNKDCVLSGIAPCGDCFGLNADTKELESVWTDWEKNDCSQGLQVSCRAYECVCQKNICEENYIKVD